jgi:hypothetical protein
MMKCFLNFFRRKVLAKEVEQLETAKTLELDDQSCETAVPDCQNNFMTLTNNGCEHIMGLKRSKECAFAQKLMHAFNHDIDQLKSCISPNAFLRFDDGVEILGHGMIETMIQIKSSFPDFHFDYEKIEESSTGIVLVSNVQVSGTHTGAPFAFGPYEPIEATGIKVANDQEDFYFTIDIDKEIVTYWRCVAKGPKSGPQSMYEQIGGLII